ncbi:hypothetical protein HKX48_005444 [Thoreauomyces humboldtii]|nr:hypothetical protein HKX48_005444 [Thoreauomyces humboldtii]
MLSLKSIVRQRPACKLVPIKPVPTAFACPRSYATVNGFVTPERAKHVLASPKRSVRGNPVDIRRQYLFEQYHEIFDSRAVFVMQNNNLTSREYSNLKNDFREKGFTTTTVRNTVFGAVITDALRGKKASGKTKGGLRNMSNLFVGPTCVAFCNATDADRPTLAKDFADVAVKYKSKVLVVGAKFDGSLLTADTLKQVINLPSMAHLRAELVGLLSMPGQGLVSMLQRTPQALLSALVQHEEALKDGGSASPSTEAK